MKNLNEVYASLRETFADLEKLEAAQRVASYQDIDDPKYGELVAVREYVGLALDRIENLKPSQRI